MFYYFKAYSLIVCIFLFHSAISNANMGSSNEVHAIFEALANPLEKSLTFKIETGQQFKLFFDYEKDIYDFQNGQEFEIIFEESIYEKDPLLELGIKENKSKLYENVPLILLGIKNLETNNEYFVKADAFYRWQPKSEDLYRVMTIGLWWFQEYGLYHTIYNDLGEFFFDIPYDGRYNGVKVMVLESINGNYKVMILHSGEVLYNRIRETYSVHFSLPPFPT